MEFKKYTYFIVSSTIVSLVIMILLSVFIDPIGIWGTQDIMGLNQNKIKQGVYLDVCKPYEISRIKPNVVWIGTSRVYVGFTMDKSANEYNMGCSNMSMPDIKVYLHHIYKNNDIKKVYLGLDLFQFGEENYYDNRLGFSAKRLEAIDRGKITELFMQIQDSMGIFKDIPATVKNSRKDKVDYFVLGQDMERGYSDKVSPEVYYMSLNYYRNGRYDKFNYCRDAMQCLRDIVSEARENNVELVMFINPVSVDIQLLQYIYGIQDTFFDIKREIVSFHPIYDFCWVNKYSTDRFNYFYDASHFRYPYGDICREAMQGKENGSALYLNSNNVGEQLNKEKELFTTWMNDNAEYSEVLQKASLSQDFKTGDLKKYIGF